MSTHVIFIFGLAIVLNALANVLLKASAIKQNPVSDLTGYLASLFNPFLIAGVASFGLALLAYRFVLGHGLKLSIAYPLMTTTGFAIVVIASHYFFDEHIHPIQWFGIALLGVGLWLVAFRVA